jgi:uncharacterized protein
VRVGLVSDTHGLMRPEAIAALKGSDLIIHAGDIGSPHVLERLRELAPTHAVRGNIDTEPWAMAIPECEIVRVGGQRLFVLHDISELSIDPMREGYGAVIFGHSHRPSAEIRDGVLFVNPGSAGPRRFRLPVTVASIVVSGGNMSPEFITLS